MKRTYQTVAAFQPYRVSLQQYQQQKSSLTIRQIFSSVTGFFVPKNISHSAEEDLTTLLYD